MFSESFEQAAKQFTSGTENSVVPSPDDTETGQSLSAYKSCKRIKFLHQLAEIYEETESRDAAMGLLELCVDEHAALHSQGGSDENTVRKLGRSF